MHLHHLFGEEPGPMAEMTYTEHLKDHRQAIHIMIDKSFRKDSKKNSEYEAFKKAYWRLKAQEIIAGT